MKRQFRRLIQYNVNGISAGAVRVAHQGGSIAHAASLHLGACIPNFFIAQFPLGEVRARLRDGFFELPKGPGLGITVDEKTLEGKRIA